MVLLKDLFNQAYKENNTTPKKRKRKKVEYDKAYGETGFLNVKLIHCYYCKNKYKYYYENTKDNVSVSSVDFLRLKEKVKDKGYPWRVTDFYHARKTAKFVGLPLYDLK